MITDNLAPLFGGGPDGVRFRQGTVVAWNPRTGANTIDVAGGTLTDVSMLTTGEAIALKPGHVVGLLGQGSAWFILGRITSPGDPNFAGASVAFGSAGAQVFGFGVTTSYVTIATSNELVVPDWADEAIVHVTGMVQVLNPTAATDYCGFRVGSSGGFGGNPAVEIRPSGQTSNAASSRNWFTGLSGGEVIPINGQVASQFATWSTQPTNAMWLSATAIYKSNV